jgi:hypothetical protein
VRDTEDKLAWCADGVERENDFVARVAPALKLDAKINPEKETNIYAPDLVVNGVVSDLKSQTTPFYTARRMFRNVKRPQGIDPQYAVSFNRKDYLRYKEHYPNLDVYFWVEWMALEGFGTKVRPLVGIYRVPFSKLAEKIEAGEAKLHEYQKRVGDQLGNARDSYGFDVREFEKIHEAFKDGKLPAPTEVPKPDE